MSFFNYISERVILPLNDLINNQTVYKNLKFLYESQWWDKEQIHRFQLNKLQCLLKHSYETVPYYRDLFNNLRLKPSDIRTLSDLRELPVLTKSIIKSHGVDQFKSNTTKKRNTILRSSSGSTGEPLYYYSTKQAYSMDIAAGIRAWYWMGYRLGDKFSKLSQNPRKRYLKRIQDKVSRNIYLAINPLIDSNFEKIISEIKSKRPKYIRSYPDSLLFLAQYLKKNNQLSYRLNAIHSTGNTLYPEMRDEIEEVFGCKIFDSYSCEGNSFITECSTHSCYHFYGECGIPEILSEDNKNVVNGIGRLITTDLFNLAQPFIRYETQDLLEITNSSCLCGRHHLSINRIIGRENDVLEFNNGRKFLVHNFTGFFQLDSKEINRSVDRFQVIKMKDSTVVFNLVVNENFNSFVSDYIRTFWENEFKTNVRIQIVDDIPLTSSGKRRFIINE